MLVVLGEGLQGDAVHEIQHATHLPADESVIRVGLRDIHRHLKSYFIPKEGFLAGLTLNHDNVTLNPNYEEILNFYGFDLESFNNALYPEPLTTEKPELTTSGNLVTTTMLTSTEEATTLVSTTPTITTESTMMDTTTVATTLLPTTEALKIGGEQTTEVTTMGETTIVMASTSDNMESTTEKMESTTGKMESTTDKVDMTTEKIESTTGKMDLTTGKVDMTTDKVGMTTGKVDLTTGNVDLTTDKVDMTTDKVESTTEKMETTRSVTEMPTTVQTRNAEDTTITTMGTTTTVGGGTTTTTTIGGGSTIIGDGTTMRDGTTTTIGDATTNTIRDATTIVDGTSTTVGDATSTTLTDTTPTTEMTTVMETTATNRNEELNLLTTENLPTLDTFRTTETFDTTTQDLNFFTTQEPFIQEILPTTAPPNYEYPFYGDQTVTPTDFYQDVDSRENLLVQPDANSTNAKRNARSVVDYIIAKYYDNNYDRFDYYEPHPKRPSYIPEEPLTFLTHGKYREGGVSFMVYDTVLPFLFIPHLNALALSFPLDNEKYYLLLILPLNPQGIDDLICDFRLNSSLKYIIKNLKLTHVKATIPSFMLKGYVVLTPTLQKLGIRKVFEPRHADFSLMTREKEIYVTNIEQAVTVTIRNYVNIGNLPNYRNLYQTEPVHFKADHPFLYFVIDADLHVALMAGKIVNPLNTRVR